MAAAEAAIVDRFSAIRWQQAVSKGVRSVFHRRTEVVTACIQFSSFSRQSSTVRPIVLLVDSYRQYESQGQRSSMAESSRVARNVDDGRRPLDRNDLFRTMSGVRWARRPPQSKPRCRARFRAESRRQSQPNVGNPSEVWDSVNSGRNALGGQVSGLIGQFRAIDCTSEPPTM